MKQFILTLFAVMLSCFTAHAQSAADIAVGTYTGDLTVNFGQVIQSKNSIQLEKVDDDHINFLLSDFGFGGQSLGSISLTNIPVSLEGDIIRFGENQPVDITLGKQGETINATAKINETESNIQNGKAHIKVDVSWIMSADQSTPIDVSFEGQKDEQPQKTSAAGVYQGTFVVTVASGGGEQKVTDYKIHISSAKDNEVTVFLKDFHFGGTMMGDVAIFNVPTKNVDGHITLGKGKEVRFKGGGADFSINVQPEGSKIEGKSATIKFDLNTLFGEAKIPMPATFKGKLVEGETPEAPEQGGDTDQPEQQTNYQIPNAGFEEWVTEHTPAAAWHSFETAKTTFLTGFGKPAAAKNTTSTDGYKSSKALRCTSSTIAGTKANGNVTTGRINMGSTSPTNAANHNYTDREGTDHLLFVGQPDSIVCMAKFKRGEEGEYKAQIHALIHGDINYKDPHETAANQKKYLIAEATMPISPATAWTRFSAEFSYTGVSAEEGKQYMLTSISTNPEAGATSGDELIVDDVRMIYNSQLLRLVYDGKEYPLSSLQGEYGICTKDFDRSKLEVYTNGHAATYTIDDSYVAQYNVLIIVVRGGDYAVNPENKHRYVIKVGADVPTGIEDITVQPSSQSSYNLKGQQVKPTEKGVYIINGKKVIR